MPSPAAYGPTARLRLVAGGPIGAGDVLTLHAADTRRPMVRVTVTVVLEAPQARQDWAAVAIEPPDNEDLVMADAPPPVPQPSAAEHEWAAHLELIGAGSFTRAPGAKPDADGFVAGKGARAQATVLLLTRAAEPQDETPPLPGMDGAEMRRLDEAEARTGGLW